uniref:RRM domain-containing protein n=2 Tax=Macrostomum lignano TaxID=282301 RepID=A0A1I8IAR7_9PLAT
MNFQLRMSFYSLYLAGMPSYYAEGRIWSMFETCGPVESVFIKQHFDNGTLQGFVNMRDWSGAEQAVNQFNGYAVEPNVKLTVRHKTNRNSYNQRNNNTANRSSNDSLSQPARSSIASNDSLPILPLLSSLPAPTAGAAAAVPPPPQPLHNNVPCSSPPAAVRRRLDWLRLDQTAMLSIYLDAKQFRSAAKFWVSALPPSNPGEPDFQTELDSWASNPASKISASVARDNVGTSGGLIACIDGLACRVQLIESLSVNLFRAFLVDIGVERRVEAAELRSLPASLAVPPCRALQVSFRGLKDDDPGLADATAQLLRLAELHNGLLTIRRCGKSRACDGFMLIPVDVLEADQESPSVTGKSLQPTPSIQASKAPTQAPTQAPTHSQTQAPTHSQTQAPNQQPTQAPTHSQTQAPTQAPNQQPTQAPNQAPTRAPSQTPNRAPNRAPTQAPNQTPTRAPTQAPKQQPTRAPNQAPSRASMALKASNSLTTAELLRITGQSKLLASLPGAFDGQLCGITTNRRLLHVTEIGPAGQSKVQQLEDRLSRVKLPQSSRLTQLPQAGTPLLLQSSKTGRLLRGVCLEGAIVYLPDRGDTLALDCTN